MIRHIVMWDLAGESLEHKQANFGILKKAFESLNGKIPGLLHLEIGMDVSHVDYAHDVVLYSEFESQVALQAYASHPAHLKAKDEVGAMRITRHQVDFVSVLK